MVAVGKQCGVPRDIVQQSRAFFPLYWGGSHALAIAQLCCRESHMRDFLAPKFDWVKVVVMARLAMCGKSLEKKIIPCSAHFGEIKGVRWPPRAEGASAHTD